MYKIGDIVEVKEPDNFQPHFWNKRFKVIDSLLVKYQNVERELNEELWLIVEVVGEPIELPRKHALRSVGMELLDIYGSRTIRSFSVTPEGQRDLILVKRNQELIIKSIEKFKLQ